MKSIFGLEEKAVAALSYLGICFSGMAVLVMERENKFVRFHALQSTLWFLTLMIVHWVLNLISSMPLLGWLLDILLSPVSWAIGAIGVISWLVLMVKAYNGQEVKIPIIGDVVRGYIYK